MNIADEPPSCFYCANYKFDVAESPHNNSTHVDTVPQKQIEQNQKRSASDISTGENLATEAGTLPRDILDKWDRIAGIDALGQLWHYIRAKRRSPSNKKSESTDETPDPSDFSIRGQLIRYRLQYQRGINGISTEYKQYAVVLWRLYLANIISLYTQEKAKRTNTKSRRKRGRHCSSNAAHTSQISVYNLFVDSLFSDLLKKNTDTRKEAKTRFDSWIQHGKRWAKLTEQFGSGILLLIPQDLSNNK